jgi:hypothetical protein
MANPAEPYSHLNLYEVLGIQRGASPEEVRSAYRLRSHMFHPDKYENYPEPLRSQLKAEAAKEFKKLTAAYEVLRDPVKRAAHDRVLDTWQGGAARPARARRAAAPAADGAGTRRAAGSARAAGTRRPSETAERAGPRERDPLLVVRPDRLDFGTLAVNSTKQLPLKISNAGGRTLFGEVTSNRAWLSVNRRTFISSSAVLFVSVDTAGLQPGEEYAGSLVVTTLNGGDQVVPVVVRVAGKPEPILAGAPSLLDFGVAQRGTTKARTIRLSNAGTGTLIGSVAVRGEWLAVSESRFRGNQVSFEVIAQTAGLRAGEHQGEILIFSNGGRASIQALIEVPPGEGIETTRTASEEREGGGAAPEAEGAAAAGASRGSQEPPKLSKDEQRELLQRLGQIEPETVWEEEFLRRIMQLVRAGDRLAPGELAKIYEMEARRVASSE